MKLVQMRSRLLAISDQCAMLINEIDRELKRKSDHSRASYSENLTPSGVRNEELKETKEKPSPQTPYKKKEKKACENNSNACAREDDSPDMQRAATSGHFVKPTLAEVAAYIAEKHYPFDAEEFWNFYESNGWRVGRNPMKSWKAACVTWKKSRDRDKERRDHIDARMSEREAARQKHIDERIAQRSENRRAGYDCDADDDAPYYTGSDYIRKCFAEFKAEQRRNGNV